MPHPLNICLVGGIYGKDLRYRARVATTPETTLERGLEDQGHAVTTFSHYDRIDYGRFDVVHVHHLGWGAVRAAFRQSRTPFVFTLHDPHVMQGCGCIRSSALRQILSRADGVIALSRMERDFLQAHYHMRAEPEIIANGINAKIYSLLPPQQRPKRNGWKLLYVGQLTEFKRVDLLIEALARLPFKIELSLAYHVNTLENTLKAQVRALGFASRIHFLGALTAEELARLYQEADVFVLPSAGEALPSVIAEAMFCGTPIVATNVGGIPEQVGRFGVTVPPNSAQALAKAIEHVVLNYQTFAAQAEEMAEFARSRASIEVMIEKHVRIYSEVAERRESQPAPSPINYLAEKGVDWLCRMRCSTW